MPDLNITEDGDLTISPAGDLSTVPTKWHHYSQQAYIRMMTPVYGFALYPALGADLESLIGMPQTVETGEYGKQLILNALNREGIFTGYGITVKAVPTSMQAIRFDIFIATGAQPQMLLSIEQNLGIE
jgi:hypothetical protein